MESMKSEMYIIQTFAKFKIEYRFAKNHVNSHALGYKNTFLLFKLKDPKDMSYLWEKCIF